MRIVNQPTTLDDTRACARTPTDGQWALPGNTALVLSAAPVDRQLRLREGVVWVTRTCSRPAPAWGLLGEAAAPDLPAVCTDHWVSAGEALRLPAGADHVVEAWPTARFELQELPPAARRGTRTTASARGRRPQATRLVGALRRLVGAVVPRSRGWA